MLEKLFRSGALVKVLRVLLQGNELHLREIGRRAGVSPSETKKELDILLQLGVITEKKSGQQRLFAKNSQSLIIRELSGIFRKMDDVIVDLRKALSEEPGVKCAFIYGSFAAGTEKPSSDIDVMAIGGVPEDELSGKIFKIQERCSRPINFILWTEQDLVEKTSEGSSFLKNLAEGKRIWLAGDENEFVRASEKGNSKKNRAR